MNTLFLSQINTIKTFLVKVSMSKIYHNQHNFLMAISVQKYCKFIDQCPLHVFAQKMITYMQNGGVHNIHCICAKKAKNGLLTCKMCKKHEKP